MTDMSALQELAARHGIAVRWTDAWGRAQTVSDSSLRAVLGAMGVPADDDASVLESTRQHERRQWTEVAPPVVVTRSGTSPASLVVRIPSETVDDVHQLRIDLESGETREVAFAPADRPADGSTTIDGRAYEARAVELPLVPHGYHRLQISHAGVTLADSLLVVAPEQCFEPEALKGDGRVWGPVAQLYGLRSGRNWGVGDFTDLRTLLEVSARHGAGIVGLSPLHALFPHDPNRASPYSPSNRLFLNPLYIDPEQVADFEECDAARTLVGSAELQTRLQALRDSELVDYPAVAGLKHRVLDLLYRSFLERHVAQGTDRSRHFDAFRREAGRALDLHATFEALQEHFHAADPRVWGWPAWPPEYRDPDGEAVAVLRVELEERIGYFAYLQWQCTIQLGSIGARSLERRLGVGLYCDLAVSMDRGGSEAWSNADCLAASASIGAPPDQFNAAGQDWGLPPLIPLRLRGKRYEPFISLLRACMRHNGALRMDHVMSLMRLYWIPAGCAATEGAYVRYPIDDLLGILALESERNACLVVGEDLGTVPAGFRDLLGRSGILSCRVLYFERAGDGSFLRPASYPRGAVASVATHDLPTLAGFWSGRDILLRDQLGQFLSEAQRDHQVIERAEARAQLLLALERAGLLPPDATVNPVSMPESTAEFAVSAHRYLARSPAGALVVQLEDVLGVVEQANLPGTSDRDHPNWRRKLPTVLEGLESDSRFTSLFDALAAERPRGALEPRPGYGHAHVAVIPRCTYRLQLNGSFGFRRATELVPYLARLGISHVYCSPYLQARAGSAHGYDITNHNRLSSELGREEDFDAFVETLRAHGMGHLLDMVPNHVGVLGTDNAWWNDVLENGEASLFADFFDIDWQPADATLTGRVLVPILGRSYGEALEDGEITLGFEAEAGRFVVRYFDHRLPVNPRSYPLILRHALAEGPAAELPDEDREELQSLVTAFGNLPARRGAGASIIRERHRDKEIYKRRLTQLCMTSPACRRRIDGALNVLTVRREAPQSIERVHAILEAQAYRLAFWRVASDEINYRRFFDINDLAALRMENRPVFEATHRRVLDLIATRKLDGLRIDHPDGLYDPGQYFSRLQQRAADMLGVPSAASDARAPSLYVVAEKILAPHERLLESWSVHGTTGYEFANSVNGLFVDPSARRRLGHFWRSFSGDATAWADVALECKRLVLRTALASELTVLANTLVRIAQANRRTRDFTLNTLRLALADVIAAFPVYRTYVTDAASETDRRHVDWAVAQAKRRSPAADPTIYDFVRDVLLGQAPDGSTPELQNAVLAFARKAQQVTAPVAAKGVEDTAFYRHYEFVSLNDVGGDPDTFGTSVRSFHRGNLARARNWPHGMLATSTHDSKRSEDVRARLDVLSELPAEWRLAVRRWARLNRSRRVQVDDQQAPSRRDEYLLYQTLVGTWPLELVDETALADYRDRIERYMIKAVREAKLHSSWLNPNEPYERAVMQFVRGLLGGLSDNLFLDALRAFLPRVARAGFWNSLSQVLCKLTSPGVPDVYQGNELWDFSLVDPDNRRPVDFALRNERLVEIEAMVAAGAGNAAGPPAPLLETPLDGRCKLYLTWRALNFRAAHEDLFRRGDYVPLVAHGTRSGHLCAYARRSPGELAIVMFPRLVDTLLGGRDHPPVGEAVWRDTMVTLPAKLAVERLVGVIDGADIPLMRRGRQTGVLASQALSAFPVALMTGA